MKPTKTKRFDAVAESRRWKDRVARRTENLSLDEVLSFFDKERVQMVLHDMQASGTAIAREEAPDA